jgi:5-methylcytosine-specific restriction endonuclease McrA
MAWGFGVPCPKPSTTRLVEKETARKDDERLSRKFRADVWKRDGGLCRLCGRAVKRTLALRADRGEVHHLRGRRVAPEHRYTVSKALLLCLRCHSDVTERRVKLPEAAKP